MFLNIGEISVLVASIAATAASVSAFFAFKAVKKTRQLAAAKLLSELLREYGEDKMLIALRGISKWREDNPNDFSEKYADLRKQRDPKGYELDEYRRVIGHYFNRIRIFCQEGLLDEDLVRRCFNRTTFQFLIDVIDKIENKHRERIIKKYHYSYLSDFYRRFL